MSCMSETLSSALIGWVGIMQSVCRTTNHSPLASFPAGASCFPLCEGNRCLVRVQVVYPRGGTTVGMKVRLQLAGGCRLLLQAG